MTTFTECRSCKRAEIRYLIVIIDDRQVQAALLIREERPAPSRLKEAERRGVRILMLWGWAGWRNLLYKDCVQMKKEKRES